MLFSKFHIYIYKIIKFILIILYIYRQNNVFQLRKMWFDSTRDCHNAAHYNQLLSIITLEMHVIKTSWLRTLFQLLPLHVQPGAPSQVKVLHARGNSCCSYYSTTIPLLLQQVSDVGYNQLDPGCSIAASRPPLFPLFSLKLKKLAAAFYRKLTYKNILFQGRTQVIIQV